MPATPTVRIHSRQPANAEHGHSSPSSTKEMYFASPKPVQAGARLEATAVHAQCPRRPGLADAVASTGYLRVASTLEEARAWGVYLGQRADVDTVALYRVRASGCVPLRAGRHVLPVPHQGAAEIVVLELVEELDPWSGVSELSRQSLASCPF